MAPTPLDWLVRMKAELDTRQANMRQLDAYYRGEHPMPFVTKAHSAKMRNEFRQLLEDSRSNFMRLVVDATEERLMVEGFRLSASRNEQADERSWEIWQANQMDSESQIAFVEALVKGVAYLSVWKTTEDEFPTIAVEDPTQTIVAYEPGTNFRRRAAALKVWTDDWTGRQRANVYLPEGIHKFERSGDKSTDGASATGEHLPIGQARQGGARVVTSDMKRASWVELPDEFVANPLGIVTIVPLRNRPRLLVEGESELADVFRVQNQINGLLFLLALAGYFGAHRQRWAAGISLMTDDAGRQRESFDAAVDKLWWDTNAEARFGEFDQTDLTPYIKAVEQKVLHIAVTTRTPRHYLLEQGQAPSGDAIKSAESGLTKKVERKQRPFGEGLEEAMRIARLFDGEGDAPVDSEVVWADAAIRTEAEITDAAMKKFQAKLIPWQQAVEDCGYSQTQIARMLEAFGGTAPEPSTSASPTPPPPAPADGGATADVPPATQ